MELKLGGHIQGSSRRERSEWVGTESKDLTERENTAWLNT